MIAKYTSADINIIALVGERGREVREFIENDLGKAAFNGRSSLCPLPISPLWFEFARRSPPLLLPSISEIAVSTSLMMDSVTRFAMAQREVGLAAGEPPSSKGYTPSVFSSCPDCLSGQENSQKAVSAFYTVLVEGDVMNDPIADSVRSILDGHIVLDRKPVGVTIPASTF